MTFTSFSSLTDSELSFVDRVSADLWRNRDEAQVARYGDGSASPEGWKFAAERLGHSWERHFRLRNGRMLSNARTVAS
jgi:hypothetical protein